MKSILFFLILFSFVNAKSESQCADLFQSTNQNVGSSDEVSFDSLFPSIKKDYPILSRIITNKFYTRSTKITNDPNWKKLQNLIADCSTFACPIHLNSDAFSISGRVQITDESNLFVLNISIDHFIAANVEPVGKKKFMRFSEQTQATNVQFLNLMSVLFSSIYYALQNNPDISIVRITGKSVVNNNLAKVLVDLGFKPGEKDPLTITNMVAGIGLIGLIPKLSEIYIKGNKNINIKVLGASKAFLVTGFGAYEFFFMKNRIVPRNWVLELKL